MTSASPRPVYRVLVIAPTSFFGDTGCHVRILEEARLVTRLGHQVEIATYRNGDDVADLTIHRTLPIPWRQHYEVGSSRHKIAFDLLLGLTVLRLLLTRRFDVIHAHLHEGSLIGIVLGWLFRVPVLCDLQGSLTDEMVDHGFLRRQHWLFRCMLQVERWIDRHAVRVVASTRHFAHMLTTEFGCLPERIQVLSDFVDTDVFDPRAVPDTAALRQELGLAADATVIVYLGLLSSYQGTDLLLEAMPHVLAAMPQCHLLLMGYPFQEEYQARTVDLGIAHAVTLTGRIPYAEAPRYLALGNVAVAPKISRTEGLGKLLNYMAMELPTVVFDLPVARAYLGDLGTYAAAVDARSLAWALLHLIRQDREQPEKQRRLRRRLRQRARDRFAWEPVGETLHQLYAELAQRKQRPRRQARS